MLVCDTSAFVNGWRVHYPQITFPSMWHALGAALEDGRIVSQREVLVELKAKDDDVFAWANDHAGCFVDPSQAVQQLIGDIQRRFEQPGVRDRADPFVIAEAEVRGFTVVTYEGTNTLTGARTKRWADKMPGICADQGVPFCILPQALAMLGVTF